MQHKTRAVIRARVRPPSLPEPLVSRPRVELLLTRLLADHALVCISATAGAGKTTAVLQAALGGDRALAWLSTDATDAATGQLLAYLEAALSVVVPGAAGVATSAIAAGVSHEEAAGLLAEAVGDEPVLIVVDDVERLDGESALKVLGAFLRYLPHSARAVLIGRVEIPVELGSASILRVAGVGEADLAFTTDEASAALAAAGSSDVDPVAAMEATGGWVAGVMFEAWRSADHVPGMGGEADPLHGYLSSQILGLLDDAERDFLIVTSVLEQVSAESAAALGLTDTVATLRALRRRHLPATWNTAEQTMRCHPRFREYLLELLERCPMRQVSEVRRRHGAMLVRDGHHEEGVSELIAAGALGEALVAAELCIESVVDRADLQRAEKWLAALAPARRSRAALAPAELMIALAGEDYRRAVTLADELNSAGELEAVAAASSRAGAAMSWSYLHAGELAAARAVLEVTAPGPPRDAMQYCLTVVEDDPPAKPPTRALSGGSFDALVMRVHYYRGYFGLIMDHPLEGWAARAGESWRIGALLDMGRLDEACRLYDAAREKGPWFTGILAVNLLRRLGRVEDAWRALREGREALRRCGSVMLEMVSHVAEAELELHLGGTPAAARAALAPILESERGRAYRFVHEQAQTCLGLALLRESDHAAAAEVLRNVVGSAARADRIFCLPAAGVYLAEAEWCLGDAAAADRAADIARDAAQLQGSDHLLLQALMDFPTVLSRRLDAESDPDSAWHGLGRLLPGLAAATRAGGGRFALTEFGRLALTVDGAEVRLRIKKSYELLAYLASRRAADLSRHQLLEVLFDGRADASTSAYLRQAVHQLRHALGPDTPFEATGGRIRMPADAPVATDSARFEELLGEAGALRGDARLEGLLDALRIVERGEYLPGVRSEWAEERRTRLAARTTDARFEAAATAYALGRFAAAEALLAAVLAADPLREAAWRLSMRLAEAVGDDARVVAAYRDCDRALAGIGAAPSSATKQLLGRLRR